MKVRVTGAGFVAVNGVYSRKPFFEIPTGFASTCIRMGWPAESTWQKLARQFVDWYASEHNDSYIYLHNDGCWWIDGPDGAGIYIAQAVNNATPLPPVKGWKPLVAKVEPLPLVQVIRGMEA